MRPRYRDGVRATRVAFIVAASWALLPVLSALPSHPAWAQDAKTASQASREQVDQQITSLLGQIETLVDEGHVTSPAGGDAAGLFSRVLVLSASASPAGLRTMADFPNVLKKRADTEHAAGHSEASTWLEVFSQVASSVIASQQPGPNAHSAASADAESEVGTTHAVSPATRQAAASATGNTDDEARPPDPRPVSNTSAATVRNTVALATQPDAPNPPPSVNSPPSMAPAVPLTNRADVSPTRRLSPPLAPATPQISPPITVSSRDAQPNTLRSDEASGGSKPAKIATLQPAASANMTSTRDHGPPASPLPSSMIDAMLKQGEAMLSIGDISAARLLFTRAAESGSGKAAIELGDTYNPIFLAERGVLGPQGDAESAKASYRKALAFGEPRARQRLVDLGEGAHTEAVGSLNKR